MDTIAKVTEMDQTDPADLKDLHQLSQLLSQAHVDVTSIANHAVYVGAVFWVAIGAIVISAIYFRQKGRSDRIKLLQTLAEKGQPIPPELLNGADWGRGSVNYIARGIVLISIGLAMVLFFLAAVGAFSGTMGRSDIVAPFLGAFPLFIGLAYLGIGLYQRRHG
jgi:hypothetical protein